MIVVNIIVYFVSWIAAPFEDMGAVLTDWFGRPLFWYRFGCFSAAMACVASGHLVVATLFFVSGFLLAERNRQELP